MTQRTTPNWDPLERLIGEELAPLFMWMGAHTTATGKEIQSYKHIHTRRYLHLDEDLGAWTYDPATPGHFAEQDVVAAIAAPLNDWLSDPAATPEQAAACFALIAKHRP